MRYLSGLLKLFVFLLLFVLYSKGFSLLVQLLRKGTRDYLDDTKWWKAAQEEDQKNGTGTGTGTTAVNTGGVPSDDIGAYLSGSTANVGIGSKSSSTKGISAPATGTSTGESTHIVPETSSMDDLLQRSLPVQQLTGRHYPFGRSGSLNIRAYKLAQGEIKQNGERKPCYFNSDGIDCDFVYDPNHPLLAQYPITPKMLLLLYLSEKLKARDSLSDIVSVYAALVTVSMEDSKIDRQTLVDRASSAFELLREKLTQALRGRAEDVVRCIHESTGEVEETVANIININPELLMPFQDATAAGFDAIEFVPPKTLYRLVDRFPEEAFDGKVFLAPYRNISLRDDNATQRAREESKDRILSFIKDALRVVTGYSQRVQKDELTRASLSVDFLVRELGV